MTLPRPRSDPLDDPPRLLLRPLAHENGRRQCPAAPERRPRRPRPRPARPGPNLPPARTHERHRGEPTTSLDLQEIRTDTLPVRPQINDARTDTYLYAQQQQPPVPPPQDSAPTWTLARVDTLARELFQLEASFPASQSPRTRRPDYDRPRPPAVHLPRRPPARLDPLDLLPPPPPLPPPLRLSSSSPTPARTDRLARPRPRNPEMLRDRLGGTRERPGLRGAHRTGGLRTDRPLGLDS